jgi:hypothetical protein
MALNWRDARVAAPVAALLAISVGVLGAYFWANPEPAMQAQAERAADRQFAARLKAACASDATYDRLKQVAFDEAIRLGSADPANLDLLSTYSLVRVEDPVVKSHDDTLDVTVCSGRFILELPPGAERGFDGEKRLAADIEYAAQAAADGSGLVYQLDGAEPIVRRLAAFDLQPRAFAREPPAGAQGPQVAAAPALPLPLEAETAPQAVAAPVAEPARRPTPVARPAPAPAPAAASQPVRQAAQTAPSFNCRYGRSSSEQMVCGNEQLASLDREMSSRFYSALDRGDTQVRAELRRSRDRFLAYREQCDTEACVAQAYRDRMNEIEDIAARP